MSAENLRDSLLTAFVGGTTPDAITTFRAALGARVSIDCRFLVRYLPSLHLDLVETDGGNSELLRSTVYALCPSPQDAFQDASDDAFQRFLRPLSNKQREVVTLFLAWVADGSFEFSTRYAAMKALRWGWAQFGVTATYVASLYTPLWSYR